MVYTYKAKAYAILVKGGRMILTEEDNKNNLPVVPEDYQMMVAELLINN
jgi:hypothetical protein